MDRISTNQIKVIDFIINNNNEIKKVLGNNYVLNFENYSIHIDEHLTIDIFAPPIINISIYKEKWKFVMSFFYYKGDYEFDKFISILKNVKKTKAQHIKDNRLVEFIEKITN